MRLADISFCTSRALSNASFIASSQILDSIDFNCEASAAANMASMSTLSECSLILSVIAACSSAILTFSSTNFAAFLASSKQFWNSIINFPTRDSVSVSSWVLLSSLLTFSSCLFSSPVTSVLSCESNFELLTKSGVGGTFASSEFSLETSGASSMTISMDESFPVSTLCPSSILLFVSSICSVSSWLLASSAAAWASLSASSALSSAALLIDFSLNLTLSDTSSNFPPSTFLSFFFFFLTSFLLFLRSMVLSPSLLFFCFTSCVLLFLFFSSLAPLTFFNFALGSKVSAFS